MHIFDQDTGVTQQDDGLFSARISDNWLINTTPNGGYIIALITNAMMQCTTNRDTPVITASYLSRCQPGDVTITVTRIAKSTQFDRFQARLSQNGEDRVFATGMFAVQKDECSLVRYETPALEIREQDQSIQIPNISSYTVYDHMNVMLDPDCCGWMAGKALSEQSEHKGWISFKDDRPFDIPAITLAADSFPPPILASQGMIAWVPTLEFSVNIRNLPRSKWLKCKFRTRFVNCGLLEEDGEIWDETNELVAISRQIAQFRPIRS